MKRSFFLIYAFLICFLFGIEGCTAIQERKEREKFVQDSILHAQDSIRKVEERARFVADSLNNVRLDSLSLIAWGQTKFGMSVKDILATETFAKSKKSVYHYGTWLTYYDKNYVQMKSEDVQSYNTSFNLKGHLSSVRAELKDGELHRVVLQSAYKDWEHLKYLISDCNFFISQFKKIYGEPEFILDGRNISSLDFTKGEEFTYSSFYIKNKVILIRLGEDSGLRKPYYRIIIYNSDFPRKPHIDTPEEIAEKEKKKQQQEFSSRNAF